MNVTDRIKTDNELWKYIFSIFPLIDIPFGIICIICSENRIATLCLLPLFPMVAVAALKSSARLNFQPGYIIFSINGVLFFILAHVSGPASPTWLMLINMTIGSSFMFNKPLIGRIFLMVFAVMTCVMFYLSGGALMDAVIIFFSLTAFLVLFSRAYAYSAIQQDRINQKNLEIDLQRKELEMKNKDILASISYARRIQYAVLPGEESIYRAIPLSFIVYQPKDIVSGDFFWFYEIDESNYILACGDCTGHGVPGAMMTVMGSSALNHIVVENKIHKPSEILKALNTHISATLRQQREHEYFVHDGMDISVVLVNKRECRITISSARRPTILISKRQLREIPGAKVSLGGVHVDEGQLMDTTLNYSIDDVLYMYTDGVTDQFGGPNQKKFTKRRLHELLLTICDLKIKDQKTRLEAAINDWQGNLDQVDDILLMGVKF